MKRRRCTRCRRTRLVKFFYTRSDTGGLHSWCKACTKEGQCARAKRKRSKEWRAANKERHRENNRRYVARLRLATLSHYSEGTNPACRCCGEDEIKFLSLDHINNDGAEERRSGRGSGIKLYRKLRQEGWPRGFQTLCFNCNVSKGFWGSCPHEER